MSHVPDERPSLKDAIQKAVDTINKLNGMLPKEKRKADALEWINDPVAENVLTLYCDGEY